MASGQQRATRVFAPHLTLLPPPLPVCSSSCARWASLLSAAAAMVRTQPEKASKAATASQEQATTATQRTHTKSCRLVKPTKTQTGQQSTQLMVQKVLNNEVASNSTTQAVSVAQSLEIVQTLLHSCLSSLAFTRGLFMENVYKKKFYHAIDNHWSYQDFASDKHSYDPKVTDVKMHGLAMWAFNRGVCKRVDQFLKLMVSRVRRFSDTSLNIRRRLASLMHCAVVTSSRCWSSSESTLIVRTICSSDTHSPLRNHQHQTALKQSRE
jgi:hypothetical protein